MATPRFEPFRADDTGARQRFLNWAVAAAALLVTVPYGVLGVLAYLAGLLVLHARPNTPGSRNLMEHLLAARELELAIGWNEFAYAKHRKALSLCGPLPHRAVLILALVGIWPLAISLDPGGATSVAIRLAIALGSALALWLAAFGRGRRTAIVFGADGLRVHGTFVPYHEITRCERRANAVLIHHSTLEAITVETSGVWTADQLLDLLSSETERARLRRAAPAAALPSGFREHATQAGWRVRIGDASSDAERHAILARVPPEEARELLEETADPALERAIHARLSGSAT